MTSFLLRSQGDALKLSIKLPSTKLKQSLIGFKKGNKMSLN
jgi:hypothetical protein